MAYQWTELEKTGNKVSSFSSKTSNTKYPSEKLVKDSLDAQTTALNSAKTELNKSIADNDTKQTNALNSAKTELNGAINALDTKQTNALNSAKSEINGKIDTLEEGIATGTAVVAEATHAANADLATNATNAILNSDGKTYSGFSKDSTGALKHNGCIIPCYKPLLTTPLKITGETKTLIYTDGNSVSGRVFRVEVQCIDDGNACIHEFRINNTDIYGAYYMLRMYVSATGGETVMLQFTGTGKNIYCQALSNNSSSPYKSSYKIVSIYEVL